MSGGTACLHCRFGWGDTTEHADWCPTQNRTKWIAHIAALERELLLEREAKCKAERERDDALSAALGAKGELGSIRYAQETLERYRDALRCILAEIPKPSLPVTRKISSIAEEVLR